MDGMGGDIQEREGSKGGEQMECLTDRRAA